MEQLWTGRRTTVDMLVDVGARKSVELRARGAAASAPTRSLREQRDRLARRRLAAAAEAKKPRGHTELSGATLQRSCAPQCCRIGAFRSRSGHSLGAGVSAIRQFRGAARTLGFAALAVALTARRGARRGRLPLRHHRNRDGARRDRRRHRAGGWPHRAPRRDRTRAARAALPAGTALTLKRLSAAPETDRYGRLNAHVFIDENGAERWFQADLVAPRPRARFRPGRRSRLRAGCCSPRSRPRAPPSLACGANRFMSWARRRTRPRSSKPRPVRAGRGQGRLGARKRRHDLCEFRAALVGGLHRHHRQAQRARVFRRGPRRRSRLSGRRVRIRGWIEERGGPWVEAARPEQIEVSEATEGGSCDWGNASGPDVRRAG